MKVWRILEVEIGRKDSQMCSSPRQAGRVRSQGDPVSRGKRPAAQPYLFEIATGDTEIADSSRP